MLEIKWEDIPIVEEAPDGYWEIYKDRTGKVLKKIFHKNEFPSDYKPNWEDDVEFPEFDEINLINQELSFVSQQETDMKIKSPSEYVVPKVDVQDGDYITIKDEGTYQTLPQDPNREVLTFRVELPSGDIKKMSLNATSQKELIMAWTDDSKKWVGKRCLVDIVKQKVFDKMKDVMYLHPEGGTPSAPSEQIDDEQ